MKTGKGKKMLALLLTVCMSVSMAVPAYAAGGNGRKGKNEKNSSSSTADAVVTLVEDDSTVEDGTELRASTYTVEDNGTSAQSDTTLKYFPVTMFNYDDRINAATHEAEIAEGLGTTWKGIYFNDGKPSAEGYCGDVTIEDGTYIIQNARAEANKVGSWLVGTTSGITSTTDQSEATQWTVKSNEDGTYTLNSDNGYMTIGEGQDGEKTSITSSNIEIVGYTGTTYNGCVQLKSGSYYLCQWGGTTATIYGGYNVNNDGGNAFYLYKVVNDSAVEKVTVNSISPLGYSDSNYWTGFKSDKHYIYSGLVKNTLDENGNIQFSVPDGGIFDASNTTTKDVYTNVGLPFVYDDSTGYYTFDAAQDSAYFKENPSSNTLLTWNDSVQTNKGSSSSIKTGFYPFNSDTTFDSADYHFGMSASISFNMTTDGKIDDRDIEFRFAGDDDVWVFVDGILVLDLGGIHDPVSGTINFANNSINFVSVEDNTSGDGAGNYTSSSQGKLFTDDNGDGLLGQTLQTFAATTNHTLTVYYLERGEGASNCKISFNLPQYDYISVTKSINDTMYEYDNSGNLVEAGSVSDALVESLSERDYEFALYTDDDVPVANAQYIVYNTNGESVGTGYTSEKGTFKVKLNQTVRVIVENLQDGYYVKETDLGSAYTAPNWSQNGQAAHTYTGDTALTSTYKSMTVIADGSDEVSDYINFTCVNTLLYPTADIADETVVIDYGIPDQIDVLANDTWTGGSGSLKVNGLAVEQDVEQYSDTVTGTYGTASINENGKLVYTLTKQMTGIERIYYQVVLASEDNTEEASTMGVGVLTIIPATSMYYEEDFKTSDAEGNSGYMVDYQGNWQVVGQSDGFYQEEGKVGTNTDSPYGSDAGYIKNSGDSYGTSMYVDTTESYAKFSYTFTGTATSFFARTTTTSGYMKVTVVVDGTDDAGEDIYYRDTIYVTDDDDSKDISNDDGSVILYNIPVFTYEAENYGNYNVTVTVAKASDKLGYGKDFWLDGIRVQNPMFDPNSEDVKNEDVTVAYNAYLADGEANNTVVTLREKLLADYTQDADGTITWVDDSNFVLFTDNNGNITKADEYESFGPKEEVYLYDGQSITFSLKDWDADANRLYIGIKAPVGNGTVEINGHSVEITNTVDSYYYIPRNYADITTITEDGDEHTIATFTIKATSSLISVTNLKVTGNVVFTIVNNQDTINGDEEV